MRTRKAERDQAIASVIGWIGAVGVFLLLATFPAVAAEPEHGVKPPLPGWARAFQVCGGCLIGIALVCGFLLWIVSRRGHDDGTQ